MCSIMALENDGTDERCHQLAGCRDSDAESSDDDVPLIGASDAKEVSDASGAESDDDGSGELADGAGLEESSDDDDQSLEEDAAAAEKDAAVARLLAGVSAAAAAGPETDAAAAEAVGTMNGGGPSDEDEHEDTRGASVESGGELRSANAPTGDCWRRDRVGASVTVFVWRAAATQLPPAAFSWCSHGQWFANAAGPDAATMVRFLRCSAAWTWGAGRGKQNTGCHLSMLQAAVNCRVFLQMGS